MKLLKLYDLIAGSKTDFTSQFKNNDALYKQANSFWNQLEGSSAIIVLMFGQPHITSHTTTSQVGTTHPNIGFCSWLLLLFLHFC